ncbi:DUF115 domain-containing protein [Shewanella sp. 3B26]|uniref:DUF115 domain-containing protein n=1 Tax=Shewanella zhuhaiensis TaxID=2919576 RepID=A0AAJ1BFF6_9GAMM|nr:6-hydroxymethylpterin diphosphokinase MptE-like protein [Shewanella zhuhaiensis]MCH4293786.1 DUF115 domain-containing protein [Shewanella zhuhaiensis]
MTDATTLQPIFAVSPFGEAYLPSINRRQFESVRSAALYKDAYPELFSKENHLHVLVGMDSGLLANYVMEGPLPKGSRYLFVELDEVLALLNVEIPLALQEKVEVLPLSAFCERVSEGVYPVYFTKKSTSLHRSQGAKMAFLPDYIKLCTVVEKRMDLETFNQSIGLTQKIFAKRTLENASDCRIPAAHLEGRFSDKDCVILAGGPSLDRHIEWVKQHQHCLTIFAVSRISKNLLAHQLTPDVVLSVDPQEVSFDLSKDMLHLDEKALFVHSTYVEPRLLSQWHGHALYMGARLPWQEEPNIDTQGPTVTNAALHLALKMGFKRIFLLGMDLCFSSSGFTHASGSYEAAAGPNLTIVGEWVKTYGGEDAETSMQLLYALQALEEEAKHCSSHQEIINLSNTAAVAKGISFQAPESISGLTPAGDKTTTLHRLVCSYPGDGQNAFLARVHSELTQASQAFREIAMLAEEAHNHSKKLALAIQKKGHSSDYFQSLQKRIDSIESTLLGKYRVLAHFIKFFGFSEFTSFLTPAQSSEWQQDAVYKMSQDYYRAFKVNADMLIGLCNEALAKNQLRLDEIVPGADIAKLADGWRQYQEPGRAQLWLRRHPQPLPSSTNAQLESLSKAFEAQLYTAPPVAKEMKSGHNSLDRVEQKLLLLFGERHIGGLQQMSRILQGFAGKDAEAKRLCQLAKSLAFSLKNESGNALAALLEIDETHLTEREYKEMASLGLKVKQPEISLLALSKLIESSDEYLPLYASVLKLTGQYQAAAETYLEYLNKYAGDVVTWIKFGQFMLEAGERDMAISAFHQAEQADPGNALAKQYLSELYRQ